MSTNENDIQDLTNSIYKTTIINGGALSIRDSENIFVYVNDNWVRNFNVQAIGKTVDELKLYSSTQIAQSKRIDEEVRRDGSKVNVFNDKTGKLLIVRVHIQYKTEWYLIVLSLPMAPGYRVPTAIGWSADRAVKVYGDNIANRLQMLDESFSKGIKQMEFDLNSFVKLVRDSIDREAKKND